MQTEHYHTMTPPVFINAQKALEVSMAEQSIARQTKENKESFKRGEWSNSKAGKALVNSVLRLEDNAEHRSFLGLIRDFITIKRTGAGRHHIAAKLLMDTGLSPEIVAFLGAKAIFNFIGIYVGEGTAVKRSSICMRIAGLLHDEWRVNVFASTDKRKQLLKTLLKDFDRRSYPTEWRKRTIKNYFDAEQLEWNGWDNRQKIVIGYAVLHLFKEATGMIEFSTCGNYIEVSEALIEHMKKLTDHQAGMFTLYQPMVVPPRPWSERNLFKGGYISRKIRPYSIIKGATKRDVARLVASDLTKVLPAINALQETPWRVNLEMAQALDWAFRTYGGNIGKLPNRDEEPLPPIPPGYNEDEQITKDHNREVFLVRDRRRGAKSRRIAANMCITMCETYGNYEKLYFPHNLDTRGRAYPIPAFLNPQGPDYAKAMLEFAKAEPAGDPDSVRWIAIATANAYGNDKVSLEERVQWVSENEEMILGIASDYRSDLRWMHVGEPFQFLRCCLEWRDLKNAGEAHTSRMVIPVDATNSGLQHYSAMLRDEVGGFFVNLIPGHARQDIYGKVADRAIELLVSEGTTTARNLIAFGLDRKMTKRQVMVVPYAGKFASCMGYTRKAIDEKITSGYTCEWDHKNNEVHQEHIVLLSHVIWRAIDQVVVKGKQAMQWLSKVASEYAKAMNKTDLPVYDRRMVWKTPDGFEVVHFREDEALNRVETKLNGRVRLSFYEGTGKLAPKDMALAVAPNFVHSLDATHLRATIMLGLEHDIRDFAMIHDSFGVHAGKMTGFLNKAIKPAFVALYEGDVLGDFADQFRPLVAVPELPDKGTLDLGGILSSEFFFS